jgi:hypothetical protein
MALPLRYLWETSNSNVTYEYWLESQLYKLLAAEETKVLQSGEAHVQQLWAKIRTSLERIKGAAFNNDKKTIYCIVNELYAELSATQ